VTDFVRQNIGKEGTPQLSFFTNPLNPIVKDVAVGTLSLLSQSSRAKDVGAIAELLIHRVRKDLNHQVVGIRCVARRELVLL